jgi:hypothetical protein
VQDSVSSLIRREMSLLFGVKLRDVFGMIFSAPLTHRDRSQIIFAACPCIRELSVEIDQSYFFSSTLCFHIFYLLYVFNKGSVNYFSKKP